MSELEIITAAAIIERILQKNSISVEQHYDFTKFRKIHRKIRKTSISGQFKKSKFDLYEENAFWLKFKHDNKCIAVLASRYEQLGERNLSEHLTGQHSRIYPKPNAVGKHHSRSTFKISGNVVYSGEFVLKEEFCGAGLTSQMVFFNFLLAYLKWRPNWFYGLMSNQLVMRGFAAQIGYTVTEPRGTDWSVPPNGVSTHDWLVAMCDKDLKDKAKIIADFGLTPFQLARKT